MNGTKYSQFSDSGSRKQFCSALVRTACASGYSDDSNTGRCRQDTDANINDYQTSTGSGAAGGGTRRLFSGTDSGDGIIVDWNVTTIVSMVQPNFDATSSSRESIHGLVESSSQAGYPNLIQLMKAKIKESLSNNTLLFVHIKEASAAANGTNNAFKNLRAIKSNVTRSAVEVIHTAGPSSYPTAEPSSLWTNKHLRTLGKSDSTGFELTVFSGSIAINGLLILVFIIFMTFGFLRAWHIQKGYQLKSRNKEFIEARRRYLEVVNSSGYTPYVDRSEAVLKVE